MARRSASSRRCRSNCSRRARSCSTGREKRASACGSRRRSASCSTRSMRWSPPNATSSFIRKTPAAATVLARIGDALRVGSLDLEHLSLELLTTGHPDSAARPSARHRGAQARGGAGRGRGDGPESARGARRDDLATRSVAQPRPAPGAGLVERRDGAGRDRRRQPRRVHPETAVCAERPCAASQPRIAGAAGSPSAWRWR